MIGRCPWCGYRVRLRKDGTIGRHWIWLGEVRQEGIYTRYAIYVDDTDGQRCHVSARPCPGGGRAPKAER